MALKSLELCQGIGTGYRWRYCLVHDGFFQKLSFCPLEVETAAEQELACGAKELARRRPWLPFAQHPNTGHL